jgi:tetratricopeptide (TPR) repeat protein
VLTWKALAKLESQPTESPHKLLEVLAGRASVREQASRLEEALQDANRILKVVPKHPRVAEPKLLQTDRKGYFILGGLLEKKKKIKSALKCYDYGISKCLQTHEAFSVLSPPKLNRRSFVGLGESSPRPPRANIR